MLNFLLDIYNDMTMEGILHNQIKAQDYHYLKLSISPIPNELRI